MSKAPSMPMYWDAYLADTTHLTTEEHGAYLLLLGAMWRRDGTVPDDDADNARILGLTKSKWRKIKARLSDFLLIENGTISQKNLQKIWKKTQEKIQANAQNGAKGGRPRSSKSKDLAKANGSISLNPNNNPNETIPEPEPYTELSTIVDNPPNPQKKSIAEIGASPPATVESSKAKIQSEFDAVWAAYPRKVGKGNALKAWVKARKIASKDEIAPGLWAHIKVWNGGTPKDKIPHLATWLNGERWHDDAGAAANRAPTSDEQMDALSAPQEDPLGQSFIDSFKAGSAPLIIQAAVKKISGDVS